MWCVKERRNLFPLRICRLSSACGTFFVATFCGFAVLTFYAFLHCLVSFSSTTPHPLPLSLFVLFFCSIFTLLSTLSFCLSPWQLPLPASSSSDDRRRVDLWRLFIFFAFGRLLACHLKSRVPGYSPDYPPCPLHSPLPLSPYQLLPDFILFGI